MKNESSCFKIKIIANFNICLLFLLSCNQLMSQPPILEMEKRFGGNNWDIPYAMKITMDTNYLIYGASQSTDGDVHGNHGDRDLWVLKLTPDFDTLWTRCYGGSDREWAENVIETNDGGYLLCSETFSFDGDVHGNHGESDAWLLKLNSDGDTLWTKSLGGAGYDAAKSILPANDSGYLLCCITDSDSGDVHGNHGSNDIWLVRMNLTGDTLWTRCYGGSESDLVQAMVQTEEGDFIMAGSSSSADGDVHGNHGGSDFFIMKVDASGDTIWTRCYGGSNNEGIYDIKKVPDNGFLLTGYTLSEDGDINNHRGDYDAWIVKLDDSGGMEWEKCLGGLDSDYTTKLLCMDDGSYIAAGYAASNDGDVHGNHGERDAWLISLDTEGDTLWTHCYGGSNTDEIQDIVRTENGFVFAGFSNSEDGDISSDGYAGHDYWIVKLISPEEPTSLPRIHQTTSIFPNPTNGKIFIENQGIIETFIYDSSGRLITRTSEKEFDMSRYHTGVYIVNLIGDTGEISSLRLILLK